MFEEIIDKLLGLKTTLEAQKEQKIAEAIQTIENEFAENVARIDKMLDECGYVAPVVVSAEETIEVCDENITCETMNNEQ